MVSEKWCGVNPLIKLFLLVFLIHELNCHDISVAFLSFELRLHRNMLHNKLISKVNIFLLKISNPYYGLESASLGYLLSLCKLFDLSDWSINIRSA